MKQSNWTKETPYCIYRHTTPSGGTYIGKTRCKNLYGRWGENGKKYFDAPAFWKAIQKYGWNNIKHEILHEGLTKAEAATLERKEITRHKLIGQNYNIAPGGEGGCGPISSETRKKIGDANRGRKISEAARQRMRESHSNMTHLTNGIISVVALDDVEKQRYIQQGYQVGRTINIKENRKNRMWLNNGKQNLLITDSNHHLLQQYLDAGYVHGHLQTQHQTPEERAISDKKKGRAHTVEMKRQKSEAVRRYGFKWMNNGHDNIRVPQTEQQKYLELGWIFGRLTKHDAAGRYISM